MIKTIVSQETYIDLLTEMKNLDSSYSFTFTQYKSILAPIALWKKYIDFEDEYVDRFVVKVSLHTVLTRLEEALSRIEPDELTANFSIRPIPQHAAECSVEVVNLKVIKNLDSCANLILKISFADDSIHSGANTR